MFDFFSPIEVLKKIPSQKAEKNINESFSFLNNNFKSLGRIMEDYHPLELLKLALWEERRSSSLKIKDGFKRVSSSLLPILLQSVLVSSYYSFGGSSKEIKIRDWERLKSLSEDSLRRIVRIIDNKTALFLTKEELTSFEGEKYREIISTYLIPQNIDERELHREYVLLQSLLESRSDIEEKFNTDYVSLSLNLYNIAKMGLNGINELCQRVQSYSDDFSLAEAKLKAEGALDGLTEREIFEKITKLNHWEGRRDKLAKERDSYDMFKLSNLSSLDSKSFSPIVASPSSLDLLSLLKLGYWPVLRFPVFTLNGELYSFVERYIPLFLILSASFDRRKSALKDLLSIFYHVGVDTYSYDGNNIDISVLPSMYDCNLFSFPENFMAIEKRREEEREIKVSFGHKRLIVDPDLSCDTLNGDGILTISSAFLAEAKIDNTKKRELIKALLGNLDLPNGESEYSIVDEDELDQSSFENEIDSDSSTIDDEEYDNEDEDEKSMELDKRDNSVALVEYERKVPCDINLLKEKYSLPDAIIKKEEEEEKEDHLLEKNLDDDIFDDTEEDERLDDIGPSQRQDEDYYDEIDEAELDHQEEGDELQQDGDEKQLDFFNLLDDECDNTSSEEKEIDNELEKEDEEEFLREEEKAEELEKDDDSNPYEKAIDEELEKEDEKSFENDEEEEESFEDESFSPEEAEKAYELSKQEELIEGKEEASDDNDDFVLPTLDEESLKDGSDSSLEDEEKKTSSFFDSLLSSVANEPDIPNEDDENEDLDEHFSDNSSQIEDDSFDNARIYDTPVDDTPVDDTPVDDTPVDDTPVDDTPVDDTPVDDTPVDDTPVEDTPVEETSVDDTDTVLPSLENDDVYSHEDDCLINNDNDEIKSDIKKINLDEAEDINVPLPQITETEEEIDVKISGIIYDIYKKLGHDSLFASFVDESDSETLEELETVIKNCWSRMLSEGKDKLFNIVDYGLSIILSKDDIRDELRFSELLNNAGGVMYARGNDSWTADILYIDSSYNLREAIEKKINKDSFSPSDWKRVSYIGEQMKKK